ncbi:MAG TPA: hypothetical protein PKH24_14390 [Sedimentisphaerales bacterium]|jgi:hypothetical protein|nr:hypothetical protein [Sedimentisphaerales bacterium]HNU29805.1 hypothetical protein [Sedimentisphaerales bacterium]
MRRAIEAFLLISLYPAGILAGRIDGLSPDSASVGETVILSGEGFGDSPGHVVVTGLRLAPVRWSDAEIQFILPHDASTGWVSVCNSAGAGSNRMCFTVRREPAAGQFEPAGLVLRDTGLLGSAFLVETDGSYLYGVLGVETLTTYRIRDDGPYELCSRTYLPQRIGDIRIHDGYLFCAGDHGLSVYRCADLQEGGTEAVASVAGGSYLAVDAKTKADRLVNGALVAACEYLPRNGSDRLTVALYEFASDELARLGTFSRVAVVGERQHGVAVDPLNAKVYVSGYRSLFGSDRYILEIDVSNPREPVLHHREETGGILAFDMETRGDILWTGISGTGTEMFRAYRLHPGAEPLALSQIVRGPFGLGRTTRVRIVDDEATVGSAWLGARPDVFLLSTFTSGTSPLAVANSVDWAFDVTGFSQRSGEGKILVADEWGGFLTYDFHKHSGYVIDHEEDYRGVVGAAMTEGLHLAGDRVYVAGRGAGVWSADRFALGDESRWRTVAWQWSQPDPQPHPISAVCTRAEPGQGTLIAALGHEKAMAWGREIYGLLYVETDEDIVPLAMSDVIDPPGAFSDGVGAVWPEPDLVYMTTGSDGFRAFVVNPNAPSIVIHQSCRQAGFGAGLFDESNAAICLDDYSESRVRQLVVGGKPGPFVAEPSLFVFDVLYPEGVPDRRHAERPITIQTADALECSKYKSIQDVEVSSSGLVAAATTGGLILFHISWIPSLNALNDAQAWKRIAVPAEALRPWWQDGWSGAFEDVAFSDDQTLYAVKVPEGVWRISVAINWADGTHHCAATGYYPGVQCGINYNLLLAGWSNPDITTLHHPYGVTADDRGVYVTGWSGKVQSLGVE